ncbi:hypothetical protein M422DRAFT_186844, partial [Sphaerobolus stellatus SS14]
APPDCGSATQHLSGKKTDKFHVMLGLACNADGPEKLPLCFIVLPSPTASRENSSSIWVQL